MPEKTIRCHQFLGGRFHEGYGRTEVSKTTENGRKKNTFDYETINLTGRNSFFRTGYQAYEIVPTHVEEKCPGVFCISNGVENGSQATRTYGLVPASGDIRDAFCILRERPFMPLEQFTEYDTGVKELTWHEGQYPDLPEKKYVFTDQARERLGRFLTAYWNTLSVRMMEPDSRDTIALHVSLDLPEAKEPEETSSVLCFQELVDFFYHTVIASYPKPVQAMTRVAFHVPWAQRKIHPAAACIVTSDQEDLHANPIYGFILSRSGDSYYVDVSKVFHPSGLSEDADEEIASVLIGDKSFSQIYQNLEAYYQQQPVKDHVILRSYDVISLLTLLDAWNEKWEGLPEQKKPAEAKKYATRYKRRYEILYKTLLKNCQIAPVDAYMILLPLLDYLLETMGSIDAGTEFQNAFAPEEISFFACCRKLSEKAGERDQNSHRKEKLNKLLVDNYAEWSKQGYPCTMGKDSQEEDNTVPMDLFILISTSAFSEKTEKETLQKAREYFREHYRLNEEEGKQKDFIAQLIRQERAYYTFDEEYILEWEKWLSECGIKKEKIHQLPFLGKLYQEALRCGEGAEEAISPAYASAFKAEMMAMETEETAEGTERIRDELKEAASDYLVEHFEQWSRSDFRSPPRNLPAKKEIFLPATVKWLNNLPVDELEESDTQKLANTIGKIQEYCQNGKITTDELCQVAAPIYDWQSQHLRIDVSFYENQEKWLHDECKLRDEKRICSLLLPLAEKLTSDEENMTEAGVLFIGKHRDAIEEAMDGMTEEEKRRAARIQDREFNFLLEHFVEWREAREEAGIGGREKSESLVRMVAKWQNENLSQTDLSSAQLKSILGSLSNIRTGDQSKLDLEPLKRQISLAEMKELTESCKKEVSPEKIRELAELYQESKKQHEGQDLDQIQDAYEMLCRHFTEWSEVNFQAGDAEPDESFFQVAQGWLEISGGGRADTLGSSGLKTIEDRLAGLRIARTEQGKSLLAQVRQLRFDTMNREARKPEQVDSNELWWDQLAEYYDLEGKEEIRETEEENRARVCMLLNEAGSRGNLYAKQKITEILKQRNNEIPEEASRNSTWAEIQRERLDEAYQQMLSRFSSPEDLGELVLAGVWKSDYEEQYSAQWSELKQKAGQEEAIKERFLQIYQDASIEDRLDLLQRFWNVSQEELTEPTNGLQSLEKKCVAGILKQDYDELWKNLSTENREILDQLILKVNEKQPLDLKNTMAVKAKAFIDAYQRTELMSVAEISGMLTEVARYPEWRGWIRMEDYEKNSSAMVRAVINQDKSVQGIGYRLLHDMAKSGETSGVTYWRGTALDVMGIHDVKEAAQVHVLSEDGGRILNAIAWLAHAAKELGTMTQKDLKQWLIKEMPDALEEIQNEGKRRNAWGRIQQNFQEGYPDFFPKDLKSLLTINL